MSIAVRVFRSALATSTGDQTFTLPSGPGLTPKGAMLLCTLATANKTAVNSGCVCVGLTDGTNTRVMAMGSNQDFDATARHGAYDNGTILAMHNGANPRGTASFVSFGTDQITINFSGAPSAAYLLTIVFFFGTDMAVQVGSFTQGNPTSTITTPWQPDVVFGVTVERVFDEFFASDGRISFGFCALGDLSQGAIGLTTDDKGADPTNVTGLISNSQYIAGATVATATQSVGLAITAKTSTNFTSTSSVGLPPTMYMALNFNGVWTAQVAAYATPTATGSQVVSGLSVAPAAVFKVLGMHTAYNTVDNATLGGALAISVFNATEAFSISHSEKHNTATPDVSNRVADGAVDLSNEDGAIVFAATATSLDATGYTLNYSATDTGTVRKGMTLVMGPAVSASTYTLTCEQGSYSILGSSALLDLTMIPEQGSYALTGQTAGLVLTKTMIMEPGAYALVGRSANLVFAGLSSAGRFMHRVLVRPILRALVRTLS